MSSGNKSEETVNSEVSETSNTAALNERVVDEKIPVTRQAWDSFLGTDRVLDVFDAGAVAAAEHKRESKSVPSKPMAVSADQLSDEVLDKIVEKVVEKMSTDVISEIAWKIVPELSEILIKRSIEEGNKSG